MKKLTIFFTEDSINTVNNFGTFAKVVNCLITLLREDESLQSKLKEMMKTI